MRRSKYLLKSAFKRDIAFLIWYFTVLTEMPSSSAICSYRFSSNLLFLNTTLHSSGSLSIAFLISCSSSFSSNRASGDNRETDFSFFSFQIQIVYTAIADSLDQIAAKGSGNLDGISFLPKMKNNIIDNTFSQKIIFQELIGNLA